VVQTDCCSCL